VRLVAQISDNQSKMKHNFNLLEFFSLIIFVPLVTSLRMVDFNVPDFASYGRRVVLKCNHQLDYKDGSLYSVKWYKLDKRGQDMTNFYTYMPNRQNRKQTKHRLQGINVLMSKSNEHQVVLKKVQIVTSGYYKCEVTTKKDSPYSGGPPYDAVSEVGRMQVVALPDEPPEISGGGTNYAYGDELDLNCTSKPTYPPTRLSWYINNQHAKDNIVVESLTKTVESLYFSATRLTMKVSPRQFKYGEMRIKCVASLMEEPIKADQSSNGIVLEVIKLPEAMKLQTENVFDVPVINRARRKVVDLVLAILVVVILTVY